MSRIVAVEPGLNKVKTHLHERGYEITDMDQCMRPVQAVIYSGHCLAGGSSAECPKTENTVLINASGLTPEEVENQLENRLS